MCTGILTPLIFWIATVLAAKSQVNYDHYKHTISQLGAMGTPSENLMNGATWLCVLLGIGFLIGLYQVCRQLHLNTSPLWGVLGFCIMFGWAATFHAGHMLHSKAGPIVLLLAIGPLLSTIKWKDDKYKTLRIWSRISCYCMLLILCRILLPEKLIHNYTGLIQRMIHLGWTIWFITMAITFLKLGNK